MKTNRSLLRSSGCQVGHKTDRIVFPPCNTSALIYRYRNKPLYSVNLLLLCQQLQLVLVSVDQRRGSKSRGLSLFVVLVVFFGHDGWTAAKSSSTAAWNPNITAGSS